MPTFTFALEKQNYEKPLCGPSHHAMVMEFARDILRPFGYDGLKPCHIGRKIAVSRGP
jgi:hypothetical protein